MEIVRPKKFLGQHFLHDENIARKIIGYINPEIPLILEIGPGRGILSKYLFKDPQLNPWFIEIDRESVAYLKETYPAIRDRIIEGDFLKFDLQKFVSSEGHRTHSPEPPLPFRGGAGGGVAIIGNFPYNISSQILFRVFEYRHLVKEVTGMFQKEVARRIASPPGSKEYGILSVLLQAFFSVEYLFTVNESVFSPPPKVKSAVLRIRRNDVDHLGCDERLWVQIVKTAFNQRRKTLRNSLRKQTGKTFSGWNDPVLAKRPEQLPVEEFVRLTHLLSGGSTGNF